jgi:hypothetical protein
MTCKLPPPPFPTRPHPRPHMYKESMSFQSRQVPPSDTVGPKP